MIRYLFPLLTFLVFQLFSCKDEEVAPAVISFAENASAFDEGEGEVTIQLNLDKPAPGDIIVNYTLSGSATADEDFEASGSLTFLNGTRTAELKLVIIDDLIFDFDPDFTETFGEILSISLSGVTGNGKLSDVADLINHTVYILENDNPPVSLSIGLSWDSGDGTPGDVDMDLILFLMSQTGPVILAASNAPGKEFEDIFIASPAPDATYGLAYRYFEGSSDNLTFNVKFKVENGLLPGNLTEKTYTGLYKLSNVNGDISQNAKVKIVQTFKKKGPDYDSFTDIEIPSSGSRSNSFGGTATGKQPAKNFYVN